MTKAELRKKYKALRSDLSIDDIENLSLEIANKTLELDIWNLEFYHLFLSITTQKEINTEYLLNILSGKDKNIVISKSDFENRSLKNFLLTDTTKIKLNRYDIPEPESGIAIDKDTIQVVFVPLLAFDKKGNRVGYGKGFYDHFLNSCQPETLKIGLSFFEAEEKIDDISTTDVALDFCVTPKKIYSF